MSIILNKRSLVITLLVTSVTLALADPDPTSTQSTTSVPPLSMPPPALETSTPAPELPLQLPVGDRSFPAPHYPSAALRARKQGTVVIHVVFDALGNVSSAVVVTSSGTPLLDTNTINWVLTQWHNPKYGKTNFTVPLSYQLDYDPNFTPILTPNAIPSQSPSLNTSPSPSPTPSAASEPTPDPTLFGLLNPHFPRPPYPPAALRARKQGTVELQLIFDSLGNVSDAEVVTSSGTPILDDAAKNWVLTHWHDPKFAGTRQTVPIEFMIAPDDPPSKPPSVPTQVPSSAQQPD